MFAASSCSSSGYPWRATPNFLIYVLVWNNSFSMHFTFRNIYYKKHFHLDVKEFLMNAPKSCLQLCGGKSSEGIFVGAFLSMSSTAVVIS